MESHFSTTYDKNQTFFETGFLKRTYGGILSPFGASALQLLKKQIVALLTKHSEQVRFFKTNL
jgi:hypothetical protein